MSAAFIRSCRDAAASATSTIGATDPRNPGRKGDEEREEAHWDIGP